jgi:nucleoside-diphosphate-sugar epimerase
MTTEDFILNHDETILITGSNGFIGSKVIEALLNYGFTNLRCLVRPSGNMDALSKVIGEHQKDRIQVIRGNLLSHEDCEKITEGVSVIYHLAAGRGEKSYPDAYLNSVVTTRNILDATIQDRSLKRFVNVSSFTVYSNKNIKRGGLLDEMCEIENHPQSRGDAYSYAKVRQDELVLEYAEKHRIPFVIVRPGVVYGPGNKGIHGRVGIGTFGIFLHLGGSNRVPLTYVDNCAEAIMLAGIKKGVEGEIFNVVDDDLPTSRTFLKMYKQNVRYFKSIYVPRAMSYFLCYLWEKYSLWSERQLPPAFNRKIWSVSWKGNRYSNEKLKKLLGWKQKVPFAAASKRYFQSEKDAEVRK